MPILRSSTALAALLFLFVPLAGAQERESVLRHRADQHGDLVFAANAILTCEPGQESNGVTCEQARTRLPRAKNNNSYRMVWVDADGDGSTFNASAAGLVLPTGAAVTWARLYWTCTTGRGTAPPDVEKIGEVKFKGPGGGYTTVTATTLDTGIADTGLGRPHLASADVTALVRARGPGTYWTANMQCGQGVTNLFGGWALVVAYEHSASPLRNLAVFDAYTRYNATPATFTVDGFLTPTSGPVRSRVGVVLGDGDANNADTLALTTGPRTTRLGDTGLNPTGDIANGTITSLGAPATGRIPADANTFGFDADLFDTTDALPNGTRSATVEAVTNGEVVYAGVVAFSTDLLAPSLLIRKSARDLNGGGVRAGDVIEYTLDVTNEGAAAAIDTTLTDAIPAFTTYVPGSIVLDGAAQSDRAGDDRAEYLANQRAVVVRPTDGKILAGRGLTVRLQVRVVDDVPSGTVVSNQAVASYAHETLGPDVRYDAMSDGNGALEGAQPTDLSPVGAPPPPVLTLTKSSLAGVGGRVDAGDAVTWRLTLSNAAGSSAAQGLVVTDVIDPALELLGVVPSRGTLTSGLSSPVRVEIGALAGGEQVTIEVRTRVRRPLFAGPVRNQAMVSGTNVEARQSDDPGTVAPNDAASVLVDAGCECFIGGSCISEDAQKPGDACFACSPATSSTDWSDRTGPGCDTDGDGLRDVVEAPNGERIDTDRDGAPDLEDPDDDGDNIPTATELSDDESPGHDLDEDGKPSYRDTDADGDGRFDRDEGTNDDDDDGAPNYLDVDAPTDAPDAGQPQFSQGGYAGGACGCDSSPLSLLAFVVFAVFLVRRRRVKAAFLALILLGSEAYATTALEPYGAFSLDRYRPAPTAEDGFGISRPGDLGHKRLSVQLQFDYANDPLVYEAVLGDPRTEVAVVRHHLVGHAGLALGLFDRVVAFAQLPVTLVMKGDGLMISPSMLDGPGVGDASFGARVRLVGAHDDAFAMALQVAATAPLATMTGGSPRYAGEQAMTVSPMLLSEVRGNATRLTLNLGTHLRRDALLGKLTIGHEITGGAGVTLTVVEDVLDLHAELSGATTFAAPFSRESTPAEALFGFKCRPSPSWMLGLAAGPGVARGVGSPDFRGILQLAYAPPAPKSEPPPPPPAPRPQPPPPEPVPEIVVRKPPPPPLDSDHDGVIDRNDGCVDEPEDRDGFRDHDGCPDPDNDKDKVPDEIDECPTDPEDRDTFEDDDGCPDPDNDQDGVQDRDDRCPLEKGPAANGGCPRVDTDGDGLNDDEDKCPKEAGPREHGGCKPPDRDGDGVLDAVDNCPDEPGDPAHQGCRTKQLVIIRKEKIEILDSVYFDTNKDVIQKRSYELLLNVATVVNAHPELGAVRIEGHTDSQGGAAHNQDLSTRRAQSVRNFLIARGDVDADRLEAQGFGPDRPIDTNATSAGRAKNRRVEFRVGAGEQ